MRRTGSKRDDYIAVSRPWREIRNSTTLVAGRLVGTFLLVLLVVKALIWAIGLGSGTSGGVLAPLLVMGGTMGALGRSILTEKLARRGRHVTREYGVNPLHVLRVEDVMEPPVAPRTAAVAPVVVYPDELLETAMRKLLEHELEVLPVASPDDPGRVVGYVERSAILGAWVQHTRDEHTREEGWLGRLRRASR